MTQARPTLRGVSHRIAFFVAAGAGAVLVATARAAPALITAAVYALTLAGLFGISSTYHLHPDERARRRWQRADHAMIFVFIAGTYTPVAVLAVGGATAARILLAVWIGAALGAVRALAWPGAPRALSALLYVALGWAVVAWWSAIAAALPGWALALLIAGGACYSAGAAVYALRWPDPRPSVFGYHEVFHALVIAGSVCHFALILSLVR